MQVLTSPFFNLSITIISDNDLVHVEYIPFYLPHLKNQALASPYIHHQIMGTTEDDKQTKTSTDRTPGQKLRPQVASSLILKQKKMPIVTKGAPNFSPKGSKLWTKTLQTVNQMPLEAKNVEKESEPLAVGGCKNASEEGSPVCAFCRL